jgi:hypothetical protein
MSSLSLPCSKRLNRLFITNLSCCLFQVTVLPADADTKALSPTPVCAGSDYTGKCNLSVIIPKGDRESAVQTTGNERTMTINFTQLE